jgi:hypothetical protein
MPLSSLPPLFEPQIGRERPVREQKAAAHLAGSSTQLNRVKLAGDFRLFKFAGSLKIIPSDLNRVLNEEV